MKSRFHAGHFCHFMKTAIRYFLLIWFYFFFSANVTVLPCLIS